MYKAQLKNDSGSYTLGWADKNYSFSAGVSLEVSEEIKEHLEATATDLKGNCLFSFTRIKDSAVIPEVPEEVSDLGEVFDTDESQKSGKKTIKKIDNK